MQTLWIYQLNRNLEPLEVEKLTAFLQAGLTEWKTHGTPVDYKMAVLHGRFVVITTKQAPSGCSVDWLNRTVEKNVASIGVSIEDPSRICYREGNTIDSLHFMELIAAVRSGRLSPDAIIFDNTVVHAGTMVNWEKPLRDSWFAARLAQQV